MVFWMHDALSPQAFWIAIVFVIGYVLITLEHLTKINKAAIALVTAILCWTLQFTTPTCSLPENVECLGFHLSSISQIIFFLLGALTIVEIVNIHHGFKVISDYIHAGSKKKLLWVIGIVTFFLSSVLDNLTTTIVMVTLLRRMITDREDRLIIGGGVVIAANAGGAWTPIGDVTTTMLWIGGQLSTGRMMLDLVIPSMVCMVVSFLILTPYLKGRFSTNVAEEHHALPPYGKLMFYLGVGVLLFVPVFKTLTGMPPFMGVLLGLAIMWVVTDWLHSDDKHPELSVTRALSKVDLSSTLFFLGILLAVDALDSAFILEWMAHWLDAKVGNTAVIASLLGIASAIVDNVPLVAASMGMYDLVQHPKDSTFWELVAYCAGTGGSILVIGSAAGVVYMGLEKVDFFWYLKRISLAALIGYFAGIGTYLIFAS